MNIISLLVLVCLSFDYSFSACNNDTTFVYENNKNNISCKGLDDSQDMYWNITYENGTDETLATCPSSCKKPKCNCNVNNSDFKVERIGNLSRLRLVRGHDRQKDGATLTCSREDGNILSHCQLKILYYTMPQCRNGQLHISEAGKRLPITCDGVGPGHNVNWTLTDDRDDVTLLASCTGRGDCTTNDDVTASKTETSSILTFVNTTGLKDNLTLTCVRKNNGTKASCRIQAFKNITTEERGKLSVVVVVGGVCAAVVVIIVVIVALVVFRRRRGEQNGLVATDSNRESEAVNENRSGDYYLPPVASRTTRQEDQLPYDNLQMSEVGLRSAYSDGGRHGNALHE